MPSGLKRYQETGDVHFITFSCYRRAPQFNKVASQTRDCCVAKNATRRAARPDPSLREERLLGMTMESVCAMAELACQVSHPPGASPPQQCVLVSRFLKVPNIEYQWLTEFDLAARANQGTNAISCT